MVAGTSGVCLVGRAFCVVDPVVGSGTCFTLSCGGGVCWRGRDAAGTPGSDRFDFSSFLLEPEREEKGTRVA